MMQLWLPKLLGTQAVHCGSLNQEPSTKNLYSYLPGFKLTFAAQLPLKSFFAESILVFQLLKVPARLPRFACGAYSLNSVGFDFIIAAIVPSFSPIIYTHQYKRCQGFFQTATIEMPFLSANLILSSLSIKRVFPASR